jgi:hypothetical protein
MIAKQSLDCGTPVPLWILQEAVIMWSAVAKPPLYPQAREACRSQDGEMNFARDKAEAIASAVQSQAKKPDKKNKFRQC